MYESILGIGMGPFPGASCKGYRRSPLNLSTLDYGSYALVWSQELEAQKLGIA